MNNKALIEAALFVSDKPLSVEKLSKILGISSEEVEKILIEIQVELQSNERGIELVSTPEGFEFRIKQAYREKVASLAPFADLGEGMMRTLAIVAVKQPIKQSTIVKYQGNKAYGYVARLEEKGLIKSEKFGRTKLLSTTPEFEKYFGKSSEEIKRILSEAEKKA